MIHFCAVLGLFSANCPGEAVVVFGMVMDSVACPDNDVVSRAPPFPITPLSDHLANWVLNTPPFSSTPYTVTNLTNYNTGTLRICAFRPALFSQ